MRELLTIARPAGTASLRAIVAGEGAWPERRLGCDRVRDGVLVRAGGSSDVEATSRDYRGAYVQQTGAAGQRYGRALSDRIVGVRAVARWVRRDLIVEIGAAVCHHEFVASGAGCIGKDDGRRGAGAEGVQAGCGSGSRIGGRCIRRRQVRWAGIGN